MNPEKVRQINHSGKYYHLESRFIVDPSPQRTPFLFQAGTSSAGSAFAATHAEAIFVSSHSPEVLRPKIDKIRGQAAQLGRDPRSLKFFATLTPIIGRTDEEAREKHDRARKYASTVGALALFSGWSGIDMSKIPIDQEISTADSEEAFKVTSSLSSLSENSVDIPRWTPRLVAEHVSLGGLGPLVVGSPSTVADTMERWISETDLDGFNIGYVTTPGTFEDVVDLLIPELQRRGVYPSQVKEGLTAREKICGQGQSKLRDDHIGSRYKYDAYKEDQSGGYPQWRTG